MKVYVVLSKEGNGGCESCYEEEIYIYGVFTDKAQAQKVALDKDAGWTEVEVDKVHKDYELRAAEYPH